MINKSKTNEKSPSEQITKVCYTRRQKATKARDSKIVKLILKNLPDKAIASELHISHSTLDWHKRNLYARTHVFSKPELIIKLLKKLIVLC